MATCLMTSPCLACFAPCRPGGQEAVLVVIAYWHPGLLCNFLIDLSPSPSVPVNPTSTCTVPLCWRQHQRGPQLGPAGHREGLAGQQHGATAAAAAAADPGSRYVRDMWIRVLASVAMWQWAGGLAISMSAVVLPSIQMHCKIAQ